MREGNNCIKCMFADVSPMCQLDTICLDKNNENYGKIIPTFTEKKCVRVGKITLLSNIRQ